MLIAYAKHGIRVFWLVVSWLQEVSLILLTKVICLLVLSGSLSSVVFSLALGSFKQQQQKHTDPKLLNIGVY